MPNLSIILIYKGLSLALEDLETIDIKYYTNFFVFYRLSSEKNFWSSFCFCTTNWPFKMSIIQFCFGLVQRSSQPSKNSRHNWRCTISASNGHRNTRVMGCDLGCWTGRTKQSSISWSRFPSYLLTNLPSSTTTVYHYWKQFIFGL